jgi:hypothetical protein
MVRRFLTQTFPSQTFHVPVTHCCLECSRFVIRTSHIQCRTAEPLGSRTILLSLKFLWESHEDSRRQVQTLLELQAWASWLCSPKFTYRRLWRPLLKSLSLVRIKQTHPHPSSVILASLQPLAHKSTSWPWVLSWTFLSMESHAVCLCVCFSLSTVSSGSLYDVARVTASLLFMAIW